MLKKIECFMNPSKLDDLTHDLLEAGVGGISVMQARGFGRQRGLSEDDAPSGPVKFLEKLKLEIVVDEDEIDHVVGILRKLAQSHAIGAGKIFVIPVEDALRISTSETGKRAIS